MKPSFPLLTTLFLVAALLSVFYFPALPEKIVTHWGADGLPNGYMSAAEGLAIIPALMIIFILGYWWLVTRKSSHKVGTLPLFAPEMHSFMPLLLGFLLYVHAVTLYYNLGNFIDVTSAILAGVGVLIILLGKLIEKISPNWLMGIRTPWTLSSKVVWKKTHALGGKVFMMWGVFALAGIFFPAHLFWLFFAPLIASVLFLVAYSYWAFRETA